MFKVGDRVVPKLDFWKPIVGMYKQLNVNVPDDPPVLTITYVYTIDGCSFYKFMYEGYGLTIAHENVLKAP